MYAHSLCFQTNFIRSSVHCSFLFLIGSIHFSSKYEISIWLIQSSYFWRLLSVILTFSTRCSLISNHIYNLTKSSIVTWFIHFPIFKTPISSINPTSKHKQWLYWSGIRVSKRVGMLCNLIMYTFIIASYLP